MGDRWNENGERERDGDEWNKDGMRVDRDRLNESVDGKIELNRKKQIKREKMK